MSDVKQEASCNEAIAKVVKQKNHDGGRIPAELSEYAELPLYVLIALWGLSQGKWIGHKQISAVFSITERRASFQLSYILRKKEIVHCQSRKVKLQGTRRLCHQIKIENVILPGMDDKAVKSEAVKSSCAYHKLKNEDCQYVA